MPLPPEDPSWTAPRTGHDWRDDRVLLACAWLKSLVDSRSMERRLNAAATCFSAAIVTAWSADRLPLYNPRDKSAWYIFQASAYATDRLNWVPEEAVRIVPMLTRIGEELTILLSIPGAEERAARVMNAEKAQPDGGLFELLVALAYKRNGWQSVEFVPEQPGISKMPDIFVARPHRRWAVECKRMDRSSYQTQEKGRSGQLMQPVHDLSLQLGRSVVMQVSFDTELSEVPDDYLVKKAQDFLDRGHAHTWQDEFGMGTVRDVDWRLAHNVMDVDDVYFGSSRMIELLIGSYNHQFEHNIAGKWRPSPERPLWASAVYQASIISWQSNSYKASLRKARHFKSLIGKANRQLLGDRPGVIHIGVESWSGINVDSFRHFLNAVELSDFDPETSRLRWVYGNYFVPEVTTRSDESWAMEETSAHYRIGNHRTPPPAPNYMMISPEEGTRAGAHWDTTM